MMQTFACRHLPSALKIRWGDPASESVLSFKVKCSFIHRRYRKLMASISLPITLKAHCSTGQDIWQCIFKPIFLYLVLEVFFRTASDSLLLFLGRNRGNTLHSLEELVSANKPNSNVLLCNGAHENRRPFRS